MAPKAVLSAATLQHLPIFVFGSRGEQHVKNNVVQGGETETENERERERDREREREREMQQHYRGIT